MNEINKQLEQGLNDLLRLIELEITPNILDDGRNK